MDEFKKRFYTFIKNEIDRYEQKASEKEPFLYAYLRNKKENNPRIVILKNYLAYIQKNQAMPETVIDTALELLYPEEYRPEKRTDFLPRSENNSFSREQCRKLVDDVRKAFPFNAKRSDGYIRLREQELLFQCKEGLDNWQYFTYLLDFTLDRALPVSKEAFCFFEAIWEGIRKAYLPNTLNEIPSGGKTREQYRKRLIVLKSFTGHVAPSKSISGTVSPALLHSLTEHLLQTIIRTDAAAWLYDVGYPAKTNKESKQTRLRPRKTDHTMELLDAFYRERGEEFDDGTRQEFSLNDSKEDITALFELLDKDKSRNKVIIPLTIDTATGTGLYIVGTEYFKNNRTYSEFKEYFKAHNCCYNVIMPTEAINSEVHGILQQMDDGSDQLYENNRLEEAYYHYSAIIDLTGEDEGYAYLFYQDNNSEPPKGCPEKYLKYFEYYPEDTPLAFEEADTIKPRERNASFSREI